MLFLPLWSAPFPEVSLILAAPRPFPFLTPWTSHRLFAAASADALGPFREVKLLSLPSAPPLSLPCLLPQLLPSGLSPSSVISAQIPESSTGTDGLDAPVPARPKMPPLMCPQLPPLPTCGYQKIQLHFHISVSLADTGILGAPASPELPTPSPSQHFKSGDFSSPLSLLVLPWFHPSLAACFSWFLTSNQAAGVHLPSPPRVLHPPPDTVPQATQDPRVAPGLAGPGVLQPSANM